MSDSRGMSSYFCFHTYFCLHRIERQCDFRRIQSIFCDKCWKKIQNQTTEMCLPNPDAVFSRPDFSVTKNFKKLAPFYITFVYILCRALKQLTKSDKQYYLSTYVCLTTNRNNYVYTYLVFSTLFMCISGCNLDENGQFFSENFLKIVTSVTGQRLWNNTTSFIDHFFGSKWLQNTFVRLRNRPFRNSNLLCRRNI
jgi:hypothetical protein